MRLRTIELICLNLLNNSKYAAPNGAFGLLIGDNYRRVAPMELSEKLAFSHRPSVLGYQV